MILKPGTLRLSVLKNNKNNPVFLIVQLFFSLGSLSATPPIIRAKVTLTPLQFYGGDVSEVTTVGSSLILKSGVDPGRKMGYM